MKLVNEWDQERVHEEVYKKRRIYSIQIGLLIKKVGESNGKRRVFRYKNHQATS